MIAEALLAVGSAGAAVAAWQVAPAAIRRFAPGHGLHRYAMSPSQLRAELAEQDREMNGLVCAMSTVSNERDDAVRSAVAWEEAAHQAADRIGELAEEAREVKQLRETVTGLRAELANAYPIRPLLADRAEEETLPHGIPKVTGAPFATTNPGRVRA